MNNLKDKRLNFLPKKKKHVMKNNYTRLVKEHPTIVLIQELCLTTMLFLI